MDEIIEKCGSFGIYQKVLLFIMGSVTAMEGYTQFVSVFNTARPEISCHHRTNHSLNLLNICQVFENITESKANNAESPFECLYDKTYYGQTIVNEWDLICDRMSLATLTQTIFQIGSLSCFFVGYLSDRFGRKKISVFSIYLLLVTVFFCEIFQQESLGLNSQIRYGIYAASQYTLGFSVYTMDIITYVLLVECTTPRHGLFIGYINWVCYVLGELALLLVAYYFRNWRANMWFAACWALFISLCIIFIAPESPRFLVVRNRMKKAAKVLSRMARFNGNADKISEEEILKELNRIVNSEDGKKLNESILMLSLTSSNIHQTVDQAQTKAPNLIDYLKSPIKNLYHAILVSYAWLSITMLYFGISLGITSISLNFNPYMMFMFSAISEIIGYSLSLLFTNHSSKRKLVIYLGLASLSCLSVVLVPLDKTGEFTFKSFLTIAFAAMSKVFCSTTFLLVYTYASRLFPTSVRNTLISYCACFGRLGAAIVPQIIILKYTVWDQLPYLILSGNTFLACVSVMLLPNEQAIRHVI